MLRRLKLLIGGRAARTPPARRGFLSRLRHDLRGVAAVEMALVAPVMIVGYFGIAEVSMAMMAHRRASHAAHAVGDLVAQSQQMNTATMTDIFKIGTTMMRPFPEASLKMRVTSVEMDEDEDIKVVWSKDTGGMGVLAVGSPVTDPKVATLLEPFDTLIVTEMSYSFTSPLGQVLPDALTFKDTSYLRPRQSDEVIWVAG